MSRALENVPQRLTADRATICPTCHGDGWIPDGDPETGEYFEAGCPACNGTGVRQ